MTTSTSVDVSASSADGSPQNSRMEMATMTEAGQPSTTGMEMEQRNASQQEQEHVSHRLVLVVPSPRPLFTVFLLGSLHPSSFTFLCRNLSDYLAAASRSRAPTATAALSPASFAEQQPPPPALFSYVSRMCSLLDSYPFFTIFVAFPFCLQV
jgi:hypothetical protein